MNVVNRSGVTLLTAAGILSEGKSEKNTGGVVYYQCPPKWIEGEEVHQKVPILIWEKGAIVYENSGFTFIWAGKDIHIYTHQKPIKSTAPFPIVCVKNTTDYAIIARDGSVVLPHRESNVPYHNLHICPEPNCSLA